MTSVLISHGLIIGFLLALISTAVPAAFGQSPNILGGAKERQPSYGEMENFTILSYTDLDGWDQAAEFRISKDGKHAYISNYQGFSIVDVSDPSKPRVISKVKNHPSVQSQYIDVLGNISRHKSRRRTRRKDKTWEGGIRLYDISDPAKPREVGFFKTDVAPRRGVHGFWLHEDPKQGKFAFIATTKEGYYDNILMIIDINDPANPKEVARWWFPGQWTAGGEKPGEDWVEPDGGLREGLPKIWVALHDITTYKDRAYLAYRDQGVIILDISDVRKPTMISQIKWSPPEEGNTHSIGIVVPAHGGRPDIIVAGDELVRPETLSLRLHARHRRSQREKSGPDFHIQAAPEQVLSSRSARPPLWHSRCRTNDQREISFSAPGKIPAFGPSTFPIRTSLRPSVISCRRCFAE